MKFLLKLARIIDWINEKIGQLMYMLVLLMVLIGAYNATARYLGSTLGANLSSNAYLELQWYLFGTIFMMGAAYTLRHDAHVRVDIFYSRLSDKGKAWVDVLGTLLFMLPFCALALWMSLHWVEFSWKIHEGSPNPSGLPRYPIKTVVPVAFGFLILQGLSQLIKSVAIIKGDLEPEKQDNQEDRAAL